MSCHIGCIGMVSLRCESCRAASNHPCFECLFTLGALVWFLSCVNLFMLLQITHVLNVLPHWVYWYGMFCHIGCIGRAYLQCEPSHATSNHWLANLLCDLSWLFMLMTFIRVFFPCQYFCCLGKMLPEFIVDWPYPLSLDKWALMC